MSIASLLSDLVRDSKIETEVLGSCFQHVFYETGHSARERHVRREERWVRQSFVGRGAYGTVYLERCEDTDKVRAVKEIKKFVIPGEDLDYTRELEAVVKFSHPKYSHCFVRSHGWFELGDSIFIAMEYLPHGDLQRYLNQPLPEVEGRQIIAQVREGLEFMHENGFVHRDLKPGNIMVVTTGPDWFVKIADFGISKRRQKDVTTLHTLQRGTFGFAAPEALGFTPDSTYTFSVDLWSLGAVAYRILTGSTAFENIADLFQYINGMIGFPTEALEVNNVSEEGQLFISSHMKPDPKDRPSAALSGHSPWMIMDLQPSVSEYTASTIADSETTEGNTLVSTASKLWSAENTVIPPANETLRPVAPSNYRSPSVTDCPEDDIVQGALAPSNYRSPSVTDCPEDDIVQGPKLPCDSDIVLELATPDIVISEEVCPNSEAADKEVADEEGVGQALTVHEPTPSLSASSCSGYDSDVISDYQDELERNKADGEVYDVDRYEEDDLQESFGSALEDEDGSDTDVSNKAVTAWDNPDGKDGLDPKVPDATPEPPAAPTPPGVPSSPIIRSKAKAPSRSIPKPPKKSARNVRWAPMEAQYSEDEYDEPLHRRDRRDQDPRPSQAAQHRVDEDAIPTSSLHASNNSGKSGVLTDCERCKDPYTYPSDQIEKLSCGHFMCHNCLLELLALALVSPRHMPPECCQHPSGDAIIDLTSYKRIILHPDVNQAFQVWNECAKMAGSWSCPRGHPPQDDSLMVTTGNAPIWKDPVTCAGCLTQTHLPFRKELAYGSKEGVRRTEFCLLCSKEGPTCSCRAGLDLVVDAFIDDLVTAGVLRPSTMSLVNETRDDRIRMKAGKPMEYQTWEQMHEIIPDPLEIPYESQGESASETSYGEDDSIYYSDESPVLSDSNPFNPAELPGRRVRRRTHHNGSEHPPIHYQIFRGDGQRDNPFSPNFGEPVIPEPRRQREPYAEAYPLSTSPPPEEELGRVRKADRLAHLNGWTNKRSALQGMTRRDILAWLSPWRHSSPVYATKFLTPYVEYAEEAHAPRASRDRRTRSPVDYPVRYPVSYPDPYSNYDQVAQEPQWSRPRRMNATERAALYRDL